VVLSYIFQRAAVTTAAVEVGVLGVHLNAVRPTAASLAITSSYNRSSATKSA
jgi:hypothetical protein